MERKTLIAILQGQRVLIPDLYPIFSTWPDDVNENLSSIVGPMDGILERYASNEAIATSLRNEDLAILTARWWPHADLETLLELVHFVACMFAVDLVVDQVSGLSQKNEMGGFEELEKDTIVFAKRDLELLHRTEWLPSSKHTTNGFWDLRQLLRRRYTTEQSRSFLSEVMFTMEMLSVQQTFRTKGSIPDFEEYCRYRSGSCCMNPMIALVEYANRLCIPDDVMQNSDMKVVKKEAARANWITNDILSVKKELEAGFVENLVVLCASGGNAQIGVDHAVALLTSSVADFEAAATKLNARYAADETLAKDIGRYVHGCRCICMGSYSWSLTTKRYELRGRESHGSGGFIVVL